MPKINPARKQVYNARYRLKEQISALEEMQPQSKRGKALKAKIEKVIAKRPPKTNYTSDEVEFKALEKLLKKIYDIKSDIAEAEKVAEEVKEYEERTRRESEQINREAMDPKYELEIDNIKAIIEDFPNGARNRRAYESEAAIADAFVEMIDDAVNKSKQGGFWTLKEIARKLRKWVKSNKLTDKLQRIILAIYDSDYNTNRYGLGTEFGKGQWHSQITKFANELDVEPIYPNFDDGVII